MTYVITEMAGYTPRRSAFPAVPGGSEKLTTVDETGTTDSSEGGALVQGVPESWVAAVK